MWVDDIRDFAYEAEDICERYVYKVSNPRQNGGWKTKIRWGMCALCDAPALHEVGSNIDDLRDRIKELMERLQLYGVKVNRQEDEISSRCNLAMMRKIDSQIEEDPIGLEEQINVMVRQLVNSEQVKVVGIFGMGGSGKTTLAWNVFEDTTIREHFKQRAWVCISKKFDSNVIFRKILVGLTNSTGEERKEISHLTNGELAQQINEILDQQQCLVVLDDIWRKRDWDTLKPAFDSISGSRSKILVTTRNAGFISGLGYVHNHKKLDDVDSWTLFKRITFSKREKAADSSTVTEIGSEAAKKMDKKKIEAYLDRQKLKHVIEIEEEDKAKEEEMEMKCYLGRQTLNHCMGIPLAIKALAGLLSTKETVAEWLFVHNYIASHLKEHMNHEGGVEGIFAVLELSYADLPYYLKPCFMYLANFPKDYEISAQRLYHLWEAEGLVTISVDNGDEIEGMLLDDIAEAYLNELVQRCLVQVRRRWVNGRIKSCRLHDIIHNMCLKQCKNVNFLTIIKHRSSLKSSSKIVSSSHITRKLRRCALHLGNTTCDDDLPFDPSPHISPSIRSLLIFQDDKDHGPKRKFSPTMSKFFSLLRVLELRKTGILVHPKTAKEFIHLRYLSFKGATFFSSLPPSIWKCKHLDTLDLRWDIGDGLSVSNQFWKLERLRHLYLPTNMKLEGSRRLILTDEQLQQMETLKNFNAEVCEIQDLWKMTGMRVFTFFIFNCLSREVVELLVKSPLGAKRRLAKPMRLHVEGDVINVDEASSVLTALHHHIYITMLHIKGRIAAAASLEECHQLKLRELWLEDSEIDQEGVSVLEKLLLLEKLILRRDSIACEKVHLSNGGFPQLEELSFYDLPELKEWEIGEGALPNLKYVHIFRCGKLKIIPQSLPNSVYVTCKHPCISGVEKYNICPHSAQLKNPSPSSTTREACMPGAEK